jgi:hypothetical protein
VISPQEAMRVQRKLAELELDAASIDLDPFLDVVARLGSPQALAAGFSLQVIESASEWLELARLLKPFRDRAIERLRALRHGGSDEELVAVAWACPGCRERRIDWLAVSEDDAVCCASCGTRYFLPSAN